MSDDASGRERDDGSDSPAGGVDGAIGRDGPEPDDYVRTGARGRREVIVPMRLYKTVTVFSTLVAVVAIVFGFLLLDAATLQVGVFRRIASWLFAIVGVRPASAALDVLLATAGLLAMAFGAGVYVLGTRFRTLEMGKSQEDSREGTGNG